ncbi:MAG: acyl-CoA dehydrogenase [Opitutaceae bacterium]|nr:acyl-CoA dehydrogenase [Opitutaceae bacterium]|tara:strand:+ start:5291 stop:6403 length:1113 start_codon:yes stop_codon:yes gene_type:complete
MNFDLNKTQQLLQESAQTFFTRECPITKVREIMESENGHDSALWNGIAEQGWTGLTLPEEFDGLGLSYVDLAAVSEEMGRACAPSAFLATSWASALIAASGNADLKSKLLPDLALGESIATVALQEDGSNWDSFSIQMKAESADSGVTLTGTKRLVMDAAVANAILVVARKGDDLIVAVVDPSAEGLEITPTEGMDLTRRFYQLVFSNVAGEILASGEAAENALKQSIQTGIIIACADLLGGMDWVLKTTVEYAQSRQQFGKPIGSYQAVQHQCADMLLLSESSRSAAYYAAWALNEGDDEANQAINIAKAYCSEAARVIGNCGIQIHGGIGFTWEHDLHIYYKRAKSNELIFGDPTHHREKLAQLMVAE